MRRWLAAWGCMLAAGSALAAEPFDAVVVRVVDGDTVAVRHGARARRQVLRIHGIDAPEACQPHGRVARAVLLSRLLGRPVRVEPLARDRHRRTVARIASGGIADVGAWLVQGGHAWSYGYGGAAGPYARLQADAETARRGLWADRTAEEPQGFRRRHGSCY